MASEFVFGRHEPNPEVEYPKSERICLARKPNEIKENTESFKTELAS